MGKQDISGSKDNKSAKAKEQISIEDDSDIIECSIIREEDANGYSRNPKSIYKTPVRRGSEDDVEFLLEKRHSECKRTNRTPKDLQSALRLSLLKNYGLTNDEESLKNLETDSLLRTPCSKNGSNSAMKKIISTLKKTPEASYLSKSKLKNIKQWLMDNEVETVRTPPFANLSVTPVGSTRTKKRQKLERRTQNEDNSMDSEVEGILRAVYGGDWERKDDLRTCKTEPKRKAKAMHTPKTDAKKTRSVRRNIMSCKKVYFMDSSDEENVNFNNSMESGVQVLNMDNSINGEEFRIVKNFNNVRKKKLDLEDSVIEIERSPVEKKPLKEVENLRRTPRTCDGAKKTKEIAKTPKTPKKTFLASLSVSTPNSRCHPEAQDFKVNFKQRKEELVKKLYKLYNGEVFEGKLSEEMNFSWNVKLRGTAGYCYNKRITKSTGEVIRMSRIEFSTKIVDRADRLRDTMIHELCHAASWVIDGVLDGHGSVWNKWASRAMTRFPELPLIKRCHNYEIVSKYVYRCTGCGYSIKRHSKSINTERKRCGHCYGVLELLLNKKRRGKNEVPEFDTTRTLPTPNKFAIFVKENYHSVKSTKANAKHAEIMKILSEQYAMTKNKF